MKKRLGIFAIAVVFTFGTGFMLQDTKTKPSDNKTNARVDGSDRDFVMKVAKDGKAEVEVGNMALTKASSQDVKNFAQRMVDDHSKANGELMQLAQSKGIQLPADEPSGDQNMKSDKTSATSDAKKKQGDHQAMMNKLTALSGAEFDREYMRHMVMDHEKAVALFERQAKSKNGDADLKNWATTTLPTLQEHLRMAREVAGKVGAQVPSGSSSSKKSSSNR